MAWIESHQELGRHPKTKRLARALQISLPTAVGHLNFLWWWATDYAQDGELTPYTDEDIADAAEWEGDAGEFVEALITARFIDRNDAGTHIHDWYEYAGRLIEQRKAQAEYKQRQYSLYNDIRLTRAVKNRDGDTCQYCGKTVNWNDRRGADGGTYDHIDPDGENNLDNIVVCCRSCNSKKGHRTPEQARMPFVFGGYELNAGDTTAYSSRYPVDTRQIQAENRREHLQLPNQTLPNQTRPDTTEQEAAVTPPASGGGMAAAPPQTEPVPYKKIMEAYNGICVRLRKIEAIDGNRKKAVGARYKTYGMEALLTVFRKANDSEFLCGNGQLNWTADFDWLMSATNMTKVLEGKYDNDQIRAAPQGVQGRQPPPSGRPNTIDVLNRIIAESEGGGGNGGTQ